MITASALAFLALSFFLIAALYASVGFGGGSSYLAILSLYLKDFLAIKTAGLLCNIAVVSGGVYLFKVNGLLHRKKFAPIIISGVPMAFWGGTFHLTQHSFFITLGAVLVISGILLVSQLYFSPEASSKPIHFRTSIEVLLGAFVGFISGLVGIGGGILLSPILNLLKWDNPKKIAALASAYILLNSVAGLAGQAFSGKLKIEMPMLGVLIIAVFLGGQLGTRISLSKIKPAVVKGLTGVLVCYIGMKLLLKYTNGIDI